MNRRLLAILLRSPCAACIVGRKYFQAIWRRSGRGWSERHRELAQVANYGLRNGVLSPMETLAQSVSTMAPTTTI